MMVPYPHQLEIAKQGLEILRTNGLVYLAMEERTGKTLIAIVMAENTKVKRILVLTKKKALMGDEDRAPSSAKEGWFGTLNKYTMKKPSLANAFAPTWDLGQKTISVTNYHQAGKLNPTYDLVILDEAHSYLSAYPKVGKIWKDVYSLAWGKPLILMSATPNAQGYQLLYNQLRLSKWSPWIKFKNFYEWFRTNGIPNPTKIGDRLQETYTKSKPECYDDVKHLFVTYTRKELGFEHEPEDVIHMVELSEKTKGIYNYALKYGILSTDEVSIALDTPMKLRTSLHMLEGGVAKDGDDYYILGNQEKIDAILNDFGDTTDLVIMHHFKPEAKKLAQVFKQATILQGTSYAEGVDLSMYKYFAIYSQDYSTAKHSQRRARQANKNRLEEIKVHFYLVKGAVSEQCYTTVSVNKTNFIDSMFTRNEL
jgi:hypothetical protein